MDPDLYFPSGNIDFISLRNSSLADVFGSTHRFPIEALRPSVRNTFSPVSSIAFLLSEGFSRILSARRTLFETKAVTRVGNRGRTSLYPPDTLAVGCLSRTDSPLPASSLSQNRRKANTGESSPSRRPSGIGKDGFHESPRDVRPLERQGNLSLKR